MDHLILRSCLRWHHRQSRSRNLRRSGVLLHSRGGSEEGECENFGWDRSSGNVWVRSSYISHICIEGRRKQSVLSFRRNDRWSHAYGQDTSAGELGGVGRGLWRVRVLER
jgi:hypothetical protein